jgi:hypothetical protein
MPLTGIRMRVTKLMPSAGDKACHGRMNGQCPVQIAAVVDPSGTETILARSARRMPAGEPARRPFHQPRTRAILQATTRLFTQIRSIMKGNINTVISSIMNIGSVPLVPTGDISRNVVTTPVPFRRPAYEAVRDLYKIVLVHLFRPRTPGFSEFRLTTKRVTGDQEHRDHRVQR